MDSNGLVDCDIHNIPASDRALDEFLPQRWRGHLARFGMRQRHGLAQGYPYPKSAPLAARVDAWPPSGAPPGADLAFTRSQHLDPLGVNFGVLNCLHRAAQATDPDLSAAVCRAVNDWQLACWLEPEPRLRASIVLPFEEPALAAEEIGRRAADRRFVQALLVVRTAEPLGRRRYWPIYEAACAAGIPVGIHFGGYAGQPITPGGWPSYYLEDHTLMAQSFQGQLASLVFEGVFERFKDLRVVLIEGGLAWLPSLMWRMDRAFEAMRDEVPELSCRPSEYVRSHVWMTTQPVEEPPRPPQLLQVFEWIGAPTHLLFATDYPHWDFDSPKQALPRAMDQSLRRAILCGNALELYGLPSERSA